jgi:hypothetical protein
MISCKNKNIINKENVEKNETNIILDNENNIILDIETEEGKYYLREGVYYLNKNNIIKEYSYEEEKDLIEKCIEKYIDSNYIYRIEVYGGLRDNVPYSLDIRIYFKPELTELNNYFNELIEKEIINKITEKIMNKPYERYIHIRTLYPFNVIFKKNTKYGLEERIQISHKIYANTKGIQIEELFNNSIFGYYVEKYFATDKEKAIIGNNNINNDFNLFLEYIKQYYEIESINF